MVKQGISGLHGFTNYIRAYLFIKAPLMCILPMHRVVAIHNLSDTRTQHLDRRRVVDRDDITGICIWKSVWDDANHHDQMVRSR